MSTNDFTISDFTADYYLKKTENNVGKIVAKEEITAEFPNFDQNHGLTRTFLTHNDNGVTANKNSLKLRVLRNGQAENIAKWETDSYYLTAYFGEKSSYVHGTQKYQLDYEIENIIMNFDADRVYDTTYQELYWNTNGTGSTIPIDHLSANIHVPEEIQDNILGTSCYVGKYGAKGSERCKTEKTADGYSFSTSNLKARENLTFVVDFKGQNFFTIPEKPTSFIAIFGIIICVLIGVFSLRCSYKGKWAPTKEKRKFSKDAPIPPQYTPMKGYTVAEMSKISLKSTKNPRVATLLELAVTHKIEIRRGEKRDWSVIIKDTNSLTTEQVDVLKILNGGGSIADGEEIEVKKHSYTSTLNRLQRDFDDSITARLKQKAAFETTDKATENKYAKRFTATFIFVVFAIVGGTTLLALLGETILGPYLYDLDNGVYNVIGTQYLPIAFTFLVLSLIISISLAVSASKYSKRTMKGLELDHYLKGLELYIKMAEQDRLNFLQSVKGADTTPKGIVKLYEKLLPYAALFGLEKSWMSELSKYYEQYDEIDHSWYYGTWAISDFNRALSVMGSSASSGSVEPGSSSGSSGGGGGGFSGGGSGGGGVGGW